MESEKKIGVERQAERKGKKVKDRWIRVERGGVEWRFREVDRGQRSTNRFSLGFALMAHSLVILV